MTDKLPAHSVLGASGTHRWFHCQASVKHVANATEQKRSVYAEEGTQAHELASQWLLTGVSPLMDDHEQLDAIRTYVDYVNRQIRKSNGQARVFIERRFRLKEIEDDIPMFGTADAAVYTPATKHLHVIDYKHGVGVPVHVYQNPQLLYYALGVWYSMGRKGVRKLTLTIVQPRAYHPDGPTRSWDISLEELLEFEDVLIERVEMVRQFPDRYEAGDHCQFCVVSGACKAHAARVLTKDIEAMTDPGLFDEKDMARALRKAKALAIWLKRVQEEALARAEGGQYPTNMKLVQGKKTRVWRNPDEALERLQEIFADDDDVDLVKQEVISPAQVEKLIGADRMEGLNDLIEYKEGKPQLVEMSDSREALGSSVDYAMKGI